MISLSLNLSQLGLTRRLKIGNDLFQATLGVQKGKWFSSFTKVPHEVSDKIHVEIIKCIQQVQEINPLVHCITNRVTPQKMANSLLAFGASPAMIDNPEEVEEFAQLSLATYFNLGLHTSQVSNIKIIEKIRTELKKEKFLLVVDPLAVGATKYRTSIIKDMLLKCQPNIIKGNVSEIQYLDKEVFLGKGVDSNTDSVTEDFQLVNIAKNVALKYNSVVVITAKRDIVFSPFLSKVAIINLDVPILTKITGTGCTVGALCAAAIAAYPQNSFVASVAAILLYMSAAFKSYQKEPFPGSMHDKIIDNIYFFANNPKLLNFQNLDIYEQGNLK